MLAYGTAILLLVTAASAQNEAEWSAHTSMRPVQQVVYHAGMVWCATGGGVLRYDPATGEYGRFTRLQGLAGNEALSAVADANGDLWFGTNGQGLSRLRLGRATFDPPCLAFAGLRVQALASIGRDLFVGTDQGISLFLGDEAVVKETYLQLGAFPKGTGVQALAVHDSVLWAAAEAGMAWADLSLPNLQDPDSWNSWSHSQQVEDVLVQEGQILCATGRGLFRYEPATSSFTRDYPRIHPFAALGTWDGAPVAASASGGLYRREGPLEWRRIAADLGWIGGLSRDAEELWIGSEQGLRRHGPPRLPDLEEPPANQFYEMVQGADGSLWLASVPDDRITPALGLYRLWGQRWQTHDRSRGLPSDVAVSLATDQQGQLWVGTWGEGLAVRLLDGSWHQLTWSNSTLWGVRDNNTFVVISDIQRDADGLMWLANVQAGLVVMDGYPPERSWRHRQGELGLGERTDMGRLAISPSGLKWLATPTDGFLLFDDGGTPFSAGDESVVHVNTQNESRLSSDRVADLVLVGEGRLWVATDNGLNQIEVHYDRGSRTLSIPSWVVHGTADGLPSDDITDLEIGAAGGLWVGTTAGLAHIDGQGDVTAYTTANSGLIDDRVRSLLYDADDEAVWIGTRHGLSRLQLSEPDTPSPGSVEFHPHPLMAGSGTPVAFATVAPGSVLRIYTLAGELVAQLQAEPGEDRIVWDGLNRAGFVVASGIYLFLLEGPDGQLRRGKLAVVRDR